MLSKSSCTVSAHLTDVGAAKPSPTSVVTETSKENENTAKLILSGKRSFHEKDSLPSQKNQVKKKRKDSKKRLSRGLGSSAVTRGSLVDIVNRLNRKDSQPVKPSSKDFVGLATGVLV
mmetsp:Transcript_17873/g.23660  ORF Transcript_17873/g.23660 Transcript_17873/m.23660 type:complete len:118 (-) Transcript_17873:79-432(-)